MDSTGETAQQVVPPPEPAPAEQVVLTDAQFFAKSSSYFERLHSQVSAADKSWKPDRVTKTIKVLVPDDTAPVEAAEEKAKSVEDAENVNEANKQESKDKETVDENNKDESKDKPIVEKRQVQPTKTVLKEVSLTPTPPEPALIHYTTEEGFTSIVKDRVILPSTKGREGPGVYLTSLDSYKVGKTAVLINNYDKVSGSDVAHLRYGIAVYEILSDCKACFMSKTYTNVLAQRPNLDDLLGFVRERESVVHDGPIHLQGNQSVPDGVKAYFWHYFRI
eukprot:Selendium_serpulae@DN2342_c0_g1_i1.p1